MAGSSNSSLISKANEVVDIYKVCDLIDMDFSGYYGSTAKLYCPFGNVVHIDGGSSKAFRIYSNTNSAYCFACSEYFSPVKLYATAKDVSYREAAEIILDLSGWVEETIESKWENLTKEVEYDTSSLPEVLDLFCSRLIPSWSIERVETPYRENLAKCLEVIPKIKTQEQAIRWLEVSKSVMRKVINENFSKQSE